jgi:pimeloyl-ACP methyl ester carboxylesterase
MQPKTQYAKSGSVNIAYQVVGDGPIDLVFTFGWVSHLDFQWAEPTLTRFLRWLAQFARVIVFDKRGTGLSDPVPHAPSLEERMDDFRVVMEAAGSERAAFIGYSEGGAMAALYAAAHPDRVSALVMYETWVCGLLDPVENPGGEKWLAVSDRILESIDHWGEGYGLELGAPSLAASPLERRMYGAFERASMSPGMARALWDAVIQGDIREVLPVVGVPTLIIHHTDSEIPVENARYAAEHIPDARYVELDGTDHLPMGHDADRIAGEIEEFLTGARGASEPDRKLATVLFTDIVRSTEMAASLGDRRWKEALQRHDAVVRAELDRFDGEEIKHTGDGFLVTFDSPARAIRFARALRPPLRNLGIEIRVGLHTGAYEISGKDLAGMSVHVGARVMAEAGPGEILVSSSVKDLVIGSEIKFKPRGTYKLKGAPGEWRLFEIDDDTKRRGTVSPAELAPVQPDLNQRLATALARRAPRLARASARLLRR